MRAALLLSVIVLFYLDYSLSKIIHSVYDWFTEDIIYIEIVRIVLFLIWIIIFITIYHLFLYFYGLYGLFLNILHAEERLLSSQLNNIIFQIFNIIITIIHFVFIWFLCFEIFKIFIREATIRRHNGWSKGYIRTAFIIILFPLIFINPIVIFIITCWDRFMLNKR